MQIRYNAANQAAVLDIRNGSLLKQNNSEFKISNMTGFHTQNQ